MRGPATRVVLAGTFCLAVLAGMLVVHAWPLWTGRTVYVRVASANARDALQNGLVTLEYAFDAVCVAPAGCTDPANRRGLQRPEPALRLSAHGRWAADLAAMAGYERRRSNDRFLYLQADFTPTGLDLPPTVAVARALGDQPEPDSVTLRGRLRDAVLYPRVALDLGIDAVYLTRGSAPAIEAAVKAGSPVFAELAVASSGQARVRALVVDGRRYQ